MAHRCSAASSPPRPPRQEQPFQPPRLWVQQFLPRRKQQEEAPRLGQSICLQGLGGGWGEGGETADQQAPERFFTQPYNAAPSGVGRIGQNDRDPRHPLCVCVRVHRGGEAIGDSLHPGPLLGWTGACCEPSLLLALALELVPRGCCRPREGPLPASGTPSREGCCWPQACKGRWWRGGQGPGGGDPGGAAGGRRRVLPRDWRPDRR